MSLGPRRAEPLMVHLMGKGLQEENPTRKAPPTVRDDKCLFHPKLREEKQALPSPASFGEVCTIKFTHSVLAVSPVLLSHSV